MAEDLDAVNRALAEHRQIREKQPAAGESLTDVEALFHLRHAYTGWLQCRPEDLPERQKQLLQTLASIRSGLQRHWSFEEKTLRSLVGEPLMKAFVIEHGEIVRRIDDAVKSLAEVKVDSPDRQDITASKTVSQDALNRALQAIEEHSNHEDIIFRMIKRALEASRT